METKAIYATIYRPVNGRGHGCINYIRTNNSSSHNLNGIFSIDELIEQTNGKVEIFDITNGKGVFTLTCKEYTYKSSLTYVELKHILLNNGCKLIFEPNKINLK